MTSARELLDQADALMRRRRAAVADDDIPVLTDEVEGVDTDASVPSRPVDSEFAELPVLTEAVGVDRAARPSVESLVDAVERAIAEETTRERRRIAVVPGPDSIPAAPDPVAAVPPAVSEALESGLVAPRGFFAIEPPPMQPLADWLPGIDQPELRTDSDPDAEPGGDAVASGPPVPIVAETLTVAVDDADIEPEPFLVPAPELAGESFFELADRSADAPAVGFAPAAQATPLPAPQEPGSTPVPLLPGSTPVSLSPGPIAGQDRFDRGLDDASDVPGAEHAQVIGEPGPFESFDSVPLSGHEAVAIPEDLEDLVAVGELPALDADADPSELQDLEDSTELARLDGPGLPPGSDAPRNEWTLEPAYRTDLAEAPEAHDALVLGEVSNPVEPPAQEPPLSVEPLASEPSISFAPSSSPAPSIPLAPSGSPAPSGLLAPSNSAQPSNFAVPSAPMAAASPPRLSEREIGDIRDQVYASVMQRLDIFTERELADRLADELRPIVHRAGSELIDRIGRDLGHLIRAFVSEAIEIEIQAVREQQERQAQLRL